MTVTINVPRRVVYVGGAAHILSLAGINRAFSWLASNADMAWGWPGAGEYVFEVTNG